MRTRGRRLSMDVTLREPTDARAELELRWRRRLTWDPRLATLVTGEGARHEPLHRWLRYKQGFSPALVREFLKENRTLGARRRGAVLLDPFAGAGTVCVECARAGVPSIGVESLEPVAFIAAAKFAQSLPPFPDISVADDLPEIARKLRQPVHRAALMLAEASRHTTSGRPHRGAQPIGAVLREIVTMMQCDLQTPLPGPAIIVRGDGRRLDFLADQSIAGILTSPPYLSRHNYVRISQPWRSVYERWHPEARGSLARDQQFGSRSHLSRQVAPLEFSCEVVSESCQALERINEAREARAVRDYFRDMIELLSTLFRVLRPGSRCWLVVGGARIKGAYVPSDLLVAQMAMESGYKVQDIRVARELIGARRKLGQAGPVAPRETLIVLQRD